MRVLQILLLPFSLVVLLTAFFILILPISILALPFKQPVRLRMTQKVWAIFGWIILRIVCLSALTKFDRRDEASQKMDIPQGLYIANHSSYMDIPVLLTCFRIPPIMKKEVLYIPIFGLCGYASGAVVVNRNSSDSRKKVYDVARERLLQGDKCLQLYPEGTRQRNSNRPKDYKEIKKPLLKFAYESNVPVYSVSIFGTRSVLNKLGLINYGKKLGIILHARTSPQDYPDVESFMRACWEKVTSGYIELEEKLS